MESNSISCITKHETSKTDLPYKAASLFGIKPNLYTIFKKKQDIAKK